MGMKRNAVIIAAGELGEIKYSRHEKDFVIAADKGYIFSQSLGIKPDLVVGDFDSLGSVPKHDNVTVLPVEKDDTDTSYAVKVALDMGIKRIFILGGLGGRFDHSFANIQLLTYIARAGAAGFLVSDNEVMTVIKDVSAFLFGREGQTVSVFSLSGKSLGVCEKGFKYTLEDAELESGFALGVSNELAEQSAELSVKKGELLVYARGDMSDFTEKNRLTDTDVYGNFNVYF